ncbi:MAG: hypothetical protein SF162_16895 [bacterium]|nr:hypothetical protein [bacterium]
MLHDPMPKGRYFISHAYKDSAVCEGLIKRLPPGVRPYIFKTVLARPDQMVSNTLIEMILACDGLIYLEKGHSAASFWVAFERDYALRAGKPVYRYDPDTGTIHRCAIAPMQLPIFPAFRSLDYPALEKLFTIMRQERFFDLFIPPVDTQGRRPFIVNMNDGTFETNLYKRLNQGGYVVIFWSRHASESEHVHQFIVNGYRYFPSDNPEFHRMIFVLLDTTPLPAWYLEKVGPYLEATPQINPVQLYPDAAFSLMNRLDTLIVRLYWLIFRNQYPELVYE